MTKNEDGVVIRRYSFEYVDKKGVYKIVDIESRGSQWAEGKLRISDEVKFISKIKSWPINEVFVCKPDLVAY
jgi:hypothetical protein